MPGMRGFPEGRDFSISSRGGMVLSLHIHLAERSSALEEGCPVDVAASIVRVCNSGVLPLFGGRILVGDQHLAPRAAIAGSRAKVATAKSNELP